MAHLYDNFDDAYAAATSDWIVKQNLHIEGRAFADDAYNTGNDPVQLYEFQMLCLAVMYMSNLIRRLFDIREIAPDQSALYESIYWANKDTPGEYELTLINMIWAYLDAPDDARSAQRLLFDAYQASMYDKPFDLEYHTRWVQRFKSWE